MTVLHNAILCSPRETCFRREFSMRIDFHTHTFPPEVAAKALPKLAAIAESRPRSDGTAAGLQRSMRRALIDYSVVHPVATKPTQVEKLNTLAAEQNKTFAQTGLLSFGTMHCAYTEYKAELRRIRSLGLLGIKLHHDYMNISVEDPRSVAILQEALDLGLIVMLHAGNDPVSRDTHYCTPSMLARVLPQLPPNGVLIAAHCGGLMNLEDALDSIIGTRVYIDTSMSHHYYGLAAISKLLLAHDPSRILFGSDSPWEEQALGLALLHSCQLPDTLIQKITSENPMRLLASVLS